jgi:2,3-bisphosphoglycerate-dependent phosphoglycerate mutase
MKGKNVIVSAHGNSLRGVMKHLDNISDSDIPHLELSLGTPIVYKYARKKLTRQNHILSFSRPVDWDKPPHYVARTK